MWEYKTRGAHLTDWGKDVCRGYKQQSAKLNGYKTNAFIELAIYGRNRFKYTKTLLFLVVQKSLFYN